MWSFTSYKKGREDGKNEVQRTTQSKKIDKETARVLQEAFKSVGWQWKVVEKDMVKMLPGRAIPKAVMDLIQQAADSQQKLAKEAAHIIKRWTGDAADSRLKSLKQGHGVCTTNIAKLSHMRDFQELPDGMDGTKENLDKLMLEMAQHTADYNEQVEVARGLVNSRMN